MLDVDERFDMFALARRRPTETVQPGMRFRLLENQAWSKERSVFLPPRPACPRAPRRGTHDIPPGAASARGNVRDHDESFPEAAPAQGIDHRRCARDVAEEIVAARAVDQERTANILDRSLDRALERKE
jgi:hypothetical protein